MNRRLLGIFALATALCSGPAMAAQNIANTSQKGSLLIFPLINVDPADDAADTLVEVSNDQNLPVHVECEYINQAKDRWTLISRSRRRLRPLGTYSLVLEKTWLLLRFRPASAARPSARLTPIRES